MLSTDYRAGRHFLQIPGPSNVPDRILRAMDRPTIDHRSREFAELALNCFAGMKAVFGMTFGQVFIYPANGTGAWEAAIVNTLSPGDRVLMFETGHFAVLWKKLAENFGLIVDFVPGDWRHGIDASMVRSRLVADAVHQIKAVLCVHCETSTGITSNIAKIRQAMDEARHPALLMVDAISSLASMEYRHETWRVDVTVASSQKGLMLPPGLSFNAVSEKALTESKKARLPRAFWSWEQMSEFNKAGFFPYTPATTLLFGLRESTSMLVSEEGLEKVWQRHRRLGEATRRAVRAWGLELLCLNADESSDSLTAVLLPPEIEESKLRGIILERFNLSLGAGLGKVKGKVFRIGHLGDFNELMLCGTLSGIEMGLGTSGIPFKREGVLAAMRFLEEN